MLTTRLRLGVFSALQLSAGCTPRPAGEPDVEPTVLDIGTSSPTATALPDDEEDAEAAERERMRDWDCGKDRSRAFLCGSSASAKASGCPADTTDLNVEVSVGRADGAVELDGALTRRYQRFKDGDEAQCCYSRCTEVVARPQGTPMPPRYHRATQCVAAMASTSHPHQTETRCAAAAVFSLSPPDYVAPFAGDASSAQTKLSVAQTGFEELTLCCYDAARPHILIRGRALRDGAGDVVTAPTTHTEAWLAEVGGLAEDAGEAARWLADAHLEHASVAAFARLSLQLMALGAPPALLAEAHRAALDEIRHARISYAVASRYAGRALGPGPLSPPPIGAVDPVALALETLRDGCIGETAACIDGHRAAAAAADPRLAALLRQMADDEERHALLAWRVLQFLLPRPGVAEALALALHEDDSEATREVVRPCLGALLAAVAA